MKTTSHAGLKKCLRRYRTRPSWNTEMRHLMKKWTGAKSKNIKKTTTKTTTQSMDTPKWKRYKALSHEKRDSEMSSKDWGHSLLRHWRECDLGEGLFDFMKRMRDIHNFIGVGTGRGSSFPNYDWDVSEDIEDERILHTRNVDVSTMTNAYFEKSKIRIWAVWRECCTRFVSTFMFDSLTPLGYVVRVEEDTDTGIHDNRSSMWRMSRLRKSRRARQCLVQCGTVGRGMWHANQTWHGACLETRRQDESALPAVVSKLVITVLPLVQIVDLEKLTSVSYAELHEVNAKQSVIDDEDLVDQCVVCIWAIDVVSDRRAATSWRGLPPSKLSLLAKWCGKTWQQYRKLNSMCYACGLLTKSGLFNTCCFERWVLNVE